MSTSPPSVEKAIRSRALPRISFRRILLFVTASVGVAWLIRQAIQGHSWALAMLFPLVALAVALALSWGLFLIAWLPAVVIARKNPDAREGNPFAADQLPPQILPPRDH